MRRHRRPTLGYRLIVLSFMALAWALVVGLAVAGLWTALFVGTALVGSFL